MREKLNSLGVPPEYHQHARHFVGVFKNLGWKPHQIDAAIRWGAGLRESFPSRPQQGVPRSDAPRQRPEPGVRFRQNCLSAGVDLIP